MKVPFSMIELYIRNIITHSFHVDNARGDDGIIYGMIIGYLLMVKLGLKADSGLKIVQWYNNVITMKDTGNLLVQHGITKCEMQEVVIQTVEPDSTI